MINKSATRIGTIEFKATGLRNTFHLGHNKNTGDTVLWQQVAGRRSQRVTGKNIVKLVAELNECLNAGDAAWVGERNDACIDFLNKYL